MKRTEVITAAHLSEITEAAVALLIDAFAAHRDTSRGASVTVRYSIRRNAETGKRSALGI